TAEIAKDSSTLPERKSSESAKDSSAAAVAPSTSTDQTNLQTTPSKTANEEHGQELEGEGAKKKVDDDDLKQEEESSPKATADESSKESEQSPKVFHGHMTSIQIASSSNGQGQHVNMSAFVVSQPGASGSTEQLQVCENEDLAKIQAIKNEIISETVCV
ncbi:unnamed protein product, partial [Anisakis simplex]|uniref:Serum opacity factor n=1 Tax=Anisakis simplex TaxID=6269 RepID=A0A0M3J4I5_ANISI